MRQKWASKLAQRLTLVFLGLFAATALPLAAQGPAFDNSGNGLLTGSFYFREVFYVADSSGDISQAVTLFGNISFDGNGNFSMANVSVNDSNVVQQDGILSLSCYLSTSSCTTNPVTSTPVAGTYVMSAGGYGYLINPITGDHTFLLVGNSGSIANGVITGSTTEGGYNDMFIAGKNSSPLPTTGTFNGSWTMAGFLPGGTPATAANVFFTMNPNGAGSLGTVSVSGYIGTSTTPQVQTSNSVPYTFSSGAAVVTFPNSNTALYFAGPEYFYFSPDNNFAFGGSPNSYDMVVGIRNDPGSTVENFSGLYFQNGVDQNTSTFATTGIAGFDSYYGSLKAGGGNIIGEQRLDSLANANSYASSFSDVYPVPVVGSTAITDGSTQYAYGDGGTIRIGAGIGPFLGLTVAVQATTVPTTNGGVYLNPQGVLNAASNAPFTAGISNGELLLLYGSNLAQSPVGAPGPNFPTTLGGVQVLINGMASPLYYVTPGVIATIVPYENPANYAVATIQVFNNGVSSNVVTEFTTKTSAGMFTLAADGLGDGAILHNTPTSQGPYVTTANPAQPGEYVQVYLTGLGNVYPGITDGTPGPTTPSLAYSTYFSTTPADSEIGAFVGGVSALVTYAGLAPGLTGLYQIDLQIPAGLTAGDNTIDIFGPDSYNAEAYIPIGSGATTLSSASEDAVSVPSVVLLRGRGMSRPIPSHEVRAKKGLPVPAFISGVR